MSRKEDEAIRELFKGEAERMAAPDSLKTRIDREIDRIENERIEKRKGSEKEAVIMKVQKRKVALAAAVIVAIGSITCYATGKMTGLMVGSSHLTEVSEYSGLDTAEEKAGFETGMPETFSNGYAFKNVNTGDGQAVDAEGNGIPGTQYTDIFMTYEKDGSEITASIMPELKEESAEEAGDAEAKTPEAAENREIGGITVSYYETTMKVVPPDYELTEQDKKDMENSNFTISYGSDQVYVQKVRSVDWKADGKAYNFLDMEGTVDAETLFSMAQDVIQGK